MDDLAKLKEAETWHERLRRLVVAKDYAGALELLRHPAPGTETDAVYEERQRAQAVINGRDGWIVELIGERDAALSAHASALARVAVLEGALRDFGKQTGLELAFCYESDPGEPGSWCVHRQSGGVNDREWTLIAKAASPLEAIRAALRTEGEGHG